MQFKSCHLFLITTRTPTYSSWILMRTQKPTPFDRNWIRVHNHATTIFAVSLCFISSPWNTFLWSTSSYPRCRCIHSSVLQLAIPMTSRFLLRQGRIWWATSISCAWRILLICVLTTKSVTSKNERRFWIDFLPMINRSDDDIVASEYFMWATSRTATTAKSNKI